MALFQIVSGQWWTSAKLFMVVLFYFEDKMHLKKLQRAKKYPLFFPQVLGTFLKYYDFPIELRQENKHHYREVYTVSRYQGSVTKTESTFMGVSLTIANEHHYVPPPNLILKDFADREDTPPRPLVVSTLKVVFSSPKPTTTLHVSVGFLSTSDIDSSSSDGYVRILVEAFKQLLARLEMIQETQENVQHTQQQLFQRVDDLIMAFQQWKFSSKK